MYAGLGFLAAKGPGEDDKQKVGDGDECLRKR
jgi:hypothetical protein